jgi:hypothetical protein
MVGWVGRDGGRAVLTCFFRRYSRKAHLQLESATPYACSLRGRSTGLIPISLPGPQQLGLGPLPGVVQSVKLDRTRSAWYPVGMHAVVFQSSDEDGWATTSRHSVPSAEGRTGHSLAPR